MDKPYHVFPPADKGEETPELLLIAVGNALTIWEGLEDELADLFSVFTGGRPGHHTTPAKRAYGAIVGFKGRQDMVAAAAEIFFGLPVVGKPDPAAWQGAKDETTSLLRDAGRFSARRNEIAHGQVKKIEIQGPILERLGIKPDTTWYLLPPRYNSKKTAPLPSHIQIDGKGKDHDTVLREHFANLMLNGLGSYKYKAEHVDSYRKEFDALMLRARKLVETIAALQA